MNAELIARLEAAEVGSRELDREVTSLFYVREQRHIGVICWDDDNDTCCPKAKHVDWIWIDPENTDRWTNAKDGYEFTTSLDAALALAERLLPEKVSSYIEIIIRGKRRTVHIGNGADTPSWTGVTHSTPALALCIAILRALDAQKAV